MTVIVVITAFIATILGSISGIGGGVIIKPVMDAILDLSASTISFLSGTTVLTMTIVSLLRSRGGETKVDRRGTFLAVGGAIGGLLGKMLFSFVAEGASDPSLVSLLQNIVMVVLTLMVLPSGLNSRIRSQQSPPLPCHCPSLVWELNIICGIMCPSAAGSTRKPQVQL